MKGGIPLEKPDHIPFPFIPEVGFAIPVELYPEALRAFQEDPEEKDKNP